MRVGASGNRLAVDHVAELPRRHNVPHEIPLFPGNDERIEQSGFVIINASGGERVTRGLIEGVLILRKILIAERAENNIRVTRLLDASRVRGAEGDKVGLNLI